MGARRTGAGSKRGGSVVVVSRPDGPVLGGNAAARELFGHPNGEPCWKRMGGLENTEGFPCEHGCTARLTSGACDQRHRVRYNGEAYELSCVPVNGKVVSVLAPGVAPEADGYEALTGREHDVLLLLVEGLNSSQIAEQLGIGTGTVRSHVDHLRAKLKVSTRAAIVGRAFRLGYVR